jgi:hypothetical protein
MRRGLGLTAVAAAVLAMSGALSPHSADAAACTKARAMTAFQMAQAMKARANACQRAAASRNMKSACSACGSFFDYSSKVHSKIMAVGIACRGGMSSGQYQKLQTDLLALSNINSDMQSRIARSCQR